MRLRTVSSLLLVSFFTFVSISYAFDQRFAEAFNRDLRQWVGELAERNKSLQSGSPYIRDIINRMDAIQSDYTTIPTIATRCISDVACSKCMEGVEGKTLERIIALENARISQKRKFIRINTSLILIENPELLTVLDKYVIYGGTKEDAESLLAKSKQTLSDYNAYVDAIITQLKQILMTIDQCEETHLEHADWYKKTGRFAVDNLESYFKIEGNRNAL